MTPLPDQPHVGLVVEGPGDREALPVLLRARLASVGDHRDLIGQPISCNGRDKALIPRGIEGKVATAAARPGCVAVLVVLDGEGDAVCTLGPDLRSRAETAAQGKPIEIVLADSKFESWIVASAEDMGLEGLAYTTSADPIHVIRTALHPRKYVKPTWQPRLAHKINLDRARARSASLARLIERFNGLVALIPLERGSGAEGVSPE